MFSLSGDASVNIAVSQPHIIHGTIVYGSRIIM